MKLVTYTLRESAPKLGLLHDGLVVDVAGLGIARGVTLPDSMLELIDRAATDLPLLKDLIKAERLPAGTAVPFENVKLLAPIPRPRKNIFGIGLNYSEHVSESARTLDTSKERPKQTKRRLSPMPTNPPACATAAQTPNRSRPPPAATAITRSAADTSPRRRVPDASCRINHATPQYRQRRRTFRDGRSLPRLRGRWLPLPQRP